ncbi:RXT2-like protein [Cercophora newfieldiana]|uniref:RXT2-like protein n=1 Tax=Cercophora newfieldiana TaxID=92897 RepID=A0AA39XXR1_9PEZI|nr:RXT2-like protein [Cercophora newfieldiana]
MSTQQQAIIAETVIAFRKALKRKAYESDSDSSIEHNTNRGYKLKKRARFVKKGRLDPSNGPAAYKEVAEHAGFRRAIINENPPLIDDEGYELDSDDNEERVQEAIAAAEDENPYSSIHLEHLLAPLTAVTDLPNHPTLSRPFTSKALTELVKQCRSLMHKENAALWKVKPLLTKLIGDNTWAPCGMMIEPNDLELFTDTERFIKRPTRPPTTSSVVGENTNEANPAQDTGKSNSDSGSHEPAQPEDEQAPKDKGKGKEPVNGQGRPETRADSNGQTDGESASDPPAEGNHQVNGASRSQPTDAPGPNGEIQADKDIEMLEARGTGIGPQEAQNGDGRAASVGVESLGDLFIHPFFLAPRSAHPDRDLALPENEAEDLRRLLQLYVQKQEEVCRGTKKLYEGLLKADRYRRTVWQWSKAEAHCGPNRDMSDGEDWYDKEEWGLTEDLKKGEDEVEEDTTQTQKKTRNRK